MSEDTRPSDTSGWCLKGDCESCDGELYVESGPHVYCVHDCHPRPAATADNAAALAMFDAQRTFTDVG
jgi:hypothetical protein